MGIAMPEKQPSPSGMNKFSGPGTQRRAMAMSSSTAITNNYNRKNNNNGRSSVCVTKDEIAKYWKRKKMEEEEHLFSALKAASRVKARALTEEDCKKFEDTLIEEADPNEPSAAVDFKEGKKEIRIGIKDWWTKSKYAYLNQPDFARSTTDAPKRNMFTFVPNFRCYTLPTTHSNMLGVF